MWKRLLIAIGYGAAGLAVAVALTFGALAIAGRDLGKPTLSTRGDHLPLAPPGSTTTPSPEATGHDRGNEGDHSGPTSSASPTDDRGGDNSGPGGGGDNSGPGSGGDDHSGSGSSGSGSGSGDDHRDD